MHFEGTNPQKVPLGRRIQVYLKTKFGRHADGLKKHGSRKAMPCWQS